MCTREKKRVCPVFLLPILLIFMTSAPASASPYFALSSSDDWHNVLSAPEGESRIESMDLTDWTLYYNNWHDVYGGLPEGMSAQPMQPELYVYEGDGIPDDPCGYPDDAGLIMTWGNESTPPGQGFAAGWHFTYGEDPDLSNCTITLTVHPPPAITNVSFALQDINNVQCSWSWTCGPVPPNDIPSSPPSTTITINTNNLNAPVPMAGAIAIGAGFDITQVVSIVINETFHSQPGVFNAPPPGPGSGINFFWNAWQDFKVVANSGGGGGTHVNSKWYVKWSQPPVMTEDGAFILGWDENSLHDPGPIMADDWKCTDERPITDFHWWGSFLGWYENTPPAVVPQAFHIGIWTDVPAGADGSFSHPDQLIWEHYCDCYVWNYAGIDLYSRPDDDIFLDPVETRDETCFQFAQFLSEDQWFFQDPHGPDGGTVYWLSLAAIYNAGDIVDHPWGWKTRPKHFNDDAVRIRQVTPDPTIVPPPLIWPPVVGTYWWSGEPVHYFEQSWDLCFELTTNEPTYADNPIPGDINADKVVNLVDFAIVAANFLRVAP